MLEKEVIKYIERIKGKRVSCIGRASNMLWLGFGNEISIKNRKGETVKKNEISLHVQSMWRIINKEKMKLLFAFQDFYTPNDSLKENEDFDWEVQGNNLFDSKAHSWLDNNLIYVNDFMLNELGDLVLIFSDGSQLEVFISSSDDTECWRLFKSCNNDAHLVVTGLGVEFE